MRLMRFAAALVLMVWVPLGIPAQEADDGPGYLAGLLQDALSGAGRDVQIRGFRGALSSEASIALLSISDAEGEWFRAENIALVWTRSALLRRAVDVDAFTAETIVISRAPIPENSVPRAEAAPLSLPDLPVSVEIKEISAQSVQLGAALVGEETAFSITGAAWLDGGATDIRFALERIDGREAQIALEASYAPGSRDLAVDFAAEEAAGGLVGRLLDIPGQPSLALTVDGRGPVDAFEAELALATDGEPRVTGSVVVRAPDTDQSLDLRLDIAGDPTPLLNADMQGFFGDEIDLQARVLRDASGRIDLPELTLAARSVALNGTAAIAPNGWPETFDVTGQLVNPDGGAVVLPFGDGDTLVGEVTFEAAYDRDLRFDAQMLAFENPAATMERLALTGRGDIDPQTLANDGRFALDLTLDTDAIAMRDPALAAAVGTQITGAARVDYGSGQAVRITGLDLSGADYGLTGTALFDASETLPLSLDLRLVAQEITRFSALAGRDLSGRTEVTIEGAVAPLSGAFDLVIDGTTLDVTVGQEVANRMLAGVGSARANIRRDETGTTIREARIVTSGVNLEAAGKIASDETALRFGGDLRNLGLLYPGEAEGRAALDGTASFAGTQLRQLDVDATLSNAAQKVVLPFAGGLTLDGGTVDIVATGGPDGTWTAQLATEDLVSDSLSATRLAVSGDGTLVQAEAGGLVSAAGDLSASSAGLRMADARISQALGASPSVATGFRWTQGGARLQLEDLAVETGALDVSGSALVQNALSVPEAQFALSLLAGDFAPLSGLAGLPLRGRGDMELTGAYTQNGPFDIRIDGQAAGLGLGNPVVNRLLAGVTTFDAAVSGNGSALSRVQLDVSNPEITARVDGPLDGLNLSARLRDLGLIAPDFTGPLGLTGTVGQQGQNLSVDVDLDGPGGTRLAVDGQVSGAANANLAISGEAPLGLANAFIAPRRLNGRAVLDLGLRGPLALSSLSGRVTPTGAELSAPTLGIVLTPITGQVDLLNSAAQIALSAQGNNGGSVDINGRFGLTDLQAALTATLTRFGIQDPALYDTSVDGTVSLTGPVGQDLLISGDLRLNETEIQVPSSGAFALGDIPNIEHLGATRPVMRTIERAGLSGDAQTDSGPSRATARLDIALSAPNRVFVRGRGLDAELGGGLRLTGPTNDIIPQGGFELVRGRLDVLNQRFVLDEGRIQLSGSFVPVLRFVASTEANGIVVRVILDGPASAPDISFTSDPELPEDEVLAQLLFGRNLSNLSALQALELANAVATLAGGGAGGLLSNLRDGFGLDDLDVTQTEDGSAAVRAGAYISENIYTDVVVESGGRTEINLNLDITSDFTARGSVDNAGNSSVGVFFERDY